jgi:hypothetical protein
MCGKVRQRPQDAPEAVTIALLGPGVADMDKANAQAEVNQTQLSPPTTLA